MGGGIVANFLLESDQASSVDAVVLDSPMLDLRATVSSAVADAGVPPITRRLAVFLAALRFDVDWDGADYLARAQEFSQPILLFHGTADEIVPVELSDELASALGSQVQYVRSEGAHHTGVWNASPEVYERALGDFLTSELGEPSAASPTCSAAAETS